VISNLGGEPKDATCPWCEGGGVFLPGHDAQAARRDADGQAARSAPAGTDAGE
jgi:hypothetical protein